MTVVHSEITKRIEGQKKSDERGGPHSCHKVEAVEMGTFGLPSTAVNKLTDVQ